MLEIPVTKLCRIGKGKRIHIRRDQTEYTLCRLGSDVKPVEDLERDMVYALTEFHPDICLSCLREYRRINE